MIIVLKQDAPEAKVHEFCRELEGMGLQINDSKGSDTHILGLIGDTKAIAESWVLANPVVETCRRVSEPYKKVILNKEMRYIFHRLLFGIMVSHREDVYFNCILMN